MHSSPRFYMQNSPCPALPCNLMSLQSFYNEWNIYCSCTAYRMKSVTISSLLASFFSPLTVISSGGVSVCCIEFLISNWMAFFQHYHITKRVWECFWSFSCWPHAHISMYFVHFSSKTPIDFKWLSQFLHSIGEPWP